jgi:hypothetical protein
MVWCNGETACPVSYIPHEGAFHHLDDVMFERLMTKEKCGNKFQQIAVITGYIPDHLERHLYAWSEEEQEYLQKFKNLNK